jgi:ribosomal protein S12 methylthiotransferase
MADRSNGLLPYLDIPFQHAHPDTLRRMARPAAAERTLDEIGPGARLPRHHAALHLHRRLPRRDRGGVPDAARLDGRGAARPRGLLQVRKRRRRAVERAARSRARRGEGRALAPLHGKGAGDLGGEAAGQGRAAMQVLVDEVDDEGATCRTWADAPEIDGNLFIDEGFEALAPGDLVMVEVDEASDYDLWGRKKNRPGCDLRRCRARRYDHPPERTWQGSRLQSKGRWRDDDQTWGSSGHSGCHDLRWHGRGSMSSDVAQG